MQGDLRRLLAAGDQPSASFCARHLGMLVEVRHTSLAASEESGVLSVIIAMALLVGATWARLRWMRPGVPGVLGGWLAAVVAGALVGVVQA